MYHVIHNTMKKLTTATFLICALLFNFESLAQDKVKEKDLIGTWKMVIDVSEEFEEAERDLEEEDSFLGEIIFDAVSGVVEGVLKNIDIYMTFKESGIIKITVNAFDEKETEYSEWEIDSRGRLHISDNDHFDSDDDDYWLMDDGVLVLIDDDDDGEISDNVYLVKID
jgi:hypothetical protein